MNASKTKTLKNIKNNIKHLKRIDEVDFFTRWLCCKSKHEKLLEKANK